MRNKDLFHPLIQTMMALTEEGKHKPTNKVGGIMCFIWLKFHLFFYFWEIYWFDEIEMKNMSYELLVATLLEKKFL